MKRIVLALFIALAISANAHGWEIVYGVTHQNGDNVVEMTGEKLDFRLSAVRDKDGDVLVKMSIPARSELRRSSFLRLEIVEQGKILLWSKLPVAKGAGGDLTTSFQIHESLAKKARVGISYDAGVKDNSLTMYAYAVRIADYIAEQEAQAR